MSGQDTDPLVDELFEEYKKAEDPDVMDLMKRCGSMELEDQLMDKIADFIGLKPCKGALSTIQLDLEVIMAEAEKLEASGRDYHLELALEFLSPRSMAI